MSTGLSQGILFACALVFELHWCQQGLATARICFAMKGIAGSPDGFNALSSPQMVVMPSRNMAT